MPALLWLPSVLRAAGLIVHEVDGWQRRTNRTYAVDQVQPRNIVVHATASRRGTSDAQEIAVLLKGSNTAPPPIAQLYLGKQGHWWVVAAGVCNHIGDAKVGGYRGNRYAIGIEASNDNRGEPWPDVQYRSYAAGVAAICRHMGWDASHVYGHKDVSSTGKTDPTFDIPTFRANVGRRLDGAPITTPGEDDDDMALTEERWQWLAGRIHGTYQMLATGVNDSALTRWQQHTTATLTALADQVADIAEALTTGGTVDPEALRRVSQEARETAAALAHLADEASPTPDGPDAG